MAQWHRASICSLLQLLWDVALAASHFCWYVTFFSSTLCYSRLGYKLACCNGEPLIAGFFEFRQTQRHDLPRLRWGWCEGYLASKKVGHGGTLDPAATGVLPIAVGRATRLLPYLAPDKAYEAVVRFGVTTRTDDLEGEILSQNPVAQIDLQNGSSPIT